MNTLMALSSLLIWLLAAFHFSKRTGVWGRLMDGMVRTTAGLPALILTIRALSDWFTLATPWPLWTVAAAGILAVEGVGVLYARERQAMGPKIGRSLLILRLAMVFILLLMLLQPVRIWEKRREIRREVAVLFDGSASMLVTDTGMEPGEKLRLAEQLGVPGAVREVRLEQPAAVLSMVRQELGAAADILAGAQASGEETSAAQAGDKALIRRLEKAARQVREAADVCESPKTKAGISNGDPAGARLGALAVAIKREGIAAITEVVALLKTTATNPPAALAACRDGRDRLRRTAAALADVEPQLLGIGGLIDDRAAHSLTGRTAEAMAAGAGTNRCALSVALWNSRLLGPDGARQSDSMAERLEKDYGVRYFVFDSTAAPISGEILRTNSAAAFRGTPEAGTDMAVALDGLARAFPPSTLAGVLIFSDGRHHAASSVEAAAKVYQQKGVPLLPVVMGGWRNPPVDAGIVSMEAPENVRTNDRVTVTAVLKADGLAGTNILVRLFRDETCVATQNIRVAGTSMRERVSMADEPRSNGLFRYTLDVQRFANEVSWTNNQASVPVMAADSPIRLLLVESRPRWEFRYLKNLFSGRDRSVRLQHVLLEPDTIFGLTDSIPVPASVSRPDGEVEATALPVSPEEWLKFDVIIVGDVQPSAFTNNESAILDRFVKERGGTLVVVAGPRAMPHAWRETGLAALLPVDVEPIPAYWLTAQEDQYRVRLTAEGRAHPLVRLAADAAESESIWNRLPALYWRHPVLKVKPGATALLYAATERDRSGSMSADSRLVMPNESSLEASKREEEKRTLMAVQQVGLGQVIYFAFDQTWRLRYWTGDAWHHTLWGQVVRSGGDSLVSGDAFSRLGASRLRYAPGERAVVRARLLGPDFSPRAEADAVAEVWKGTQLVARGNMEPMRGRTGYFEKDFGPMPAGDYRVTLTETDSNKSVETGFSVMAPEAAAELAELSADRGLLARLAAMTGGRMIEAWRLEDASDCLKAPRETLTERRQWELWDSWWVYALVLGLAAAEWLLRKRSGLI